MKVLLISPPRESPVFADFPPIGLAYLAGTLRKNKINVKVIDAAAYSWNILEKCIRAYDFNIVGITCWTIERKQAFLAAKLIRECQPNAKIVLGGQHATAFPEHMFTLAEADVVVLGEGEKTFLELVQTFERGGSLSSINGIVYEENSRIYKTDPRPMIENLDEIPFPDYEDFDFTLYNGLPEINEPCAALITSRGCPYKCIFCSSTVFWGKRWRARSAENILEEMKSLNQRFGIRAFFFFDDTFTASKRRVVKLCRMIIDEGFKIKWACCSRVDQVDEEILYWMKKAGCYRIDYGVESGSPKILRNIKKGITVDDIRRAFRLTHQVGILPRAYLMIGNPGENEETVEETARLIKEIEPYNSFWGGQFLWVLPNAEIYDTMKKRGLISDSFWLENLQTCFYTAEHFLEDLEQLRNKLWNRVTVLLLEERLLLFKERGGLNVIIFGASKTGRDIFDICMKIGINVIAFIDNNKKKQGESFMGKSVVPPSKVKEYHPDGIIIGSVAYQEEIYAQLKNLYNDNEIEIIKVFPEKIHRAMI